MKNRAIALSASAAFAFLLVGSPAGAVTVSIGLQQTGVNGGAITTEATGTGSASISPAVSYGTFSSVSVDGTGNPPLVGNSILLSNTINTSTTGSGTLNIFVTTQGNTSPTGAVNFISSFTENLITAGWTVTEKTFLDAGNGQYALTTPLSSTTFTAGGFITANALASLAAPWSLTEEYIVTAVGAGNSNSTINASVSPVPIPGALPLFASGLLGLHLLARRRKRKASLA